MFDSSVHKMIICFALLLLRPLRGWSLGPMLLFLPESFRLIGSLSSLSKALMTITCNLSKTSTFQAALVWGLLKALTVGYWGR